MSDLSGFSPRLKPQPVHQRGVYVTVEPYDTGEHGAALWHALGGTAETVSALLYYFPNLTLPALTISMPGLKIRMLRAPG
nr:hypothetical protein [Marinicella sp. W31]MDC2879544.1 hypothetical protein [Marinicella sp. W31]